MASPARNSLLCPNCNRLISVDEARCPYCNTRRPGAWWKNNRLIRAVADSDGLVRSVIFICVGMYLVSLFLNSRLPSFSMNPFYLLSPENRSLLFMGATGTIPIDRFGRMWTLLSAIYLHGGLLHLFFNMVAFYQLAPLTIREYGNARSIILFTLGGMAGFWISYRAGVSFTIGASGAICALIGALIYYGKSRGGVYGQAVFRQLGGWAVAILVFGFVMPGINNWAHGGGFLSGMALGYFLGYREKKPDNVLHKSLAAGCVVLTVGVLIWAAGSGIYYRIGAG
jgi:rhomboid protease GluP